MIATTSKPYGPQQVVKVDYFDFPCDIFEICELDFREIADNFWVFRNSDFFRTNFYF